MRTASKRQDRHLFGLLHIDRNDAASRRYEGGGELLAHAKTTKTRSDFVPLIVDVKNASN